MKIRFSYKNNNNNNNKHLNVKYVFSLVSPPLHQKVNTYNSVTGVSYSIQFLLYQPNPLEKDGTYFWFVFITFTVELSKNRHGVKRAADICALYEKSEF